MDTTLIKIARYVAQTGSFASVARRMDVAPSSVSRSVAALEDQIGLRLFHRSTRRMALTEEGRLFLERVSPLLEELDQARDDAATLRVTPQGTVRLTASVAFGTTCLLPLLPRLRDALPKVALDLVLTDQTVDLVENAIDIAVRLAPAPSGDLISTRLMSTRYRVCAAPGYVSGAGRPVTPADLRDHDCLLYGLPEIRDVWRFRATTGQIVEQDVTGPVRISNAMALHEAARRGLGLALLADWLIKADLTSGLLVDLFPDWQVTPTTFDTGAWILYPSRRFLPAKTRAVIDFLKENLPRG